MNVLHLGIAALVGAVVTADPASAQGAAAFDATGSQGPRVVVECNSRHSPPLADVARVVGTKYDLWASFVARQRLIALAQPACARGADLVAFVAAADPDTHDLRLAIAAADVP